MINGAIDSLFPACAGVILNATMQTRQYLPFPRMCGGDPPFMIGSVIMAVFSPHVRGNVWGRGKLLYDEVMKYVRAKYGEVSFAK